MMISVLGYLLIFREILERLERQAVLGHQVKGYIIYLFTQGLT